MTMEYNIRILACIINSDPESLDLRKILEDVLCTDQILQESKKGALLFRAVKNKPCEDKIIPG
jgi:hypothetical protein